MKGAVRELHRTRAAFNNVLEVLSLQQFRSRREGVCPPGNRNPPPPAAKDTTHTHANNANAAAVGLVTP